MLSISVSEFIATRVGLAMRRRSKFEYIVSRKSEIFQSLSYLNRSALKSPRTTTLFYFQLKGYLGGVQDNGY